MRSFLLAGSATLAVASTVTPIQKVVQMMGDMVKKGEKEMQDEKIQFATYNQFCRDTKAEKEHSIEEANSDIQTFDAKATKNESDAEELGLLVQKLDSEIGAAEGQKADAMKIRKEEKADFFATRTDYEESIDAVKRATEVLKRQDYDRKQKAKESVSLIQNLSTISEGEKSAIRAAFLQEAQAPQANAYEFQSGGVVQMFEELTDKFIKELRSAEKEEMNKQHAHNMLVQSLVDQLRDLNQSKSEAEETRGKKMNIAAQARQDQKETTAQRDEDAKYLKDLNTECAIKRSDFAKRTQLRKEELVAVREAIEILSSGAVSGNSEKHLPQLIQSTSFLQIKSTKDSMKGDDEVKRQELLRLFQEAAKETNSKTMSYLAMKVTEDPFKKVKTLIEDLINKLKDEEQAEAEHHGFCQTELAKNKSIREAKTKQAEDLVAESEELKAKIAEMTERVEDLNAAVADLQKATREATSMRATEKAKNEQTIKDAKEAQVAVAKALQVLRDFYDKAGNAEALVQVPGAPEIFDKAYTGMQGESGGVVGMVEVIESDFVRLETETRTEEDTAAREYQQFMDDSAVDIDLKQATVKNLTKKTAKAQKDLADTQNDLTATNDQLKAANETFEKLKPTCMPKPMSYEERVAARKAEVASLKEALTILEG